MTKVVLIAQILQIKIALTATLITTSTIQFVFRFAQTLHFRIIILNSVKIALYLVLTVLVYQYIIALLAFQDIFLISLWILVFNVKHLVKPAILLLIIVLLAFRTTLYSFKISIRPAVYQILQYNFIMLIQL